MVDVSELTADVHTLAASVVDAQAELETLRKQIADLESDDVSQADIDALDAQVEAAQTALDSAVKQDSSDGSVAQGAVTQAGTPYPSIGDLADAPQNPTLQETADATAPSGSDDEDDADDDESGEANDAAPDQDVVTAPATDSAPASEDSSSSETTEAATESAPQPEETPVVSA